MHIYANIYRRQSGWIKNERVLNGYDFGVITQIPSIPNSKLTINRYDFYSNIPKYINKSSRQSGTKLRAEYFLTPYMSFGGELDRSDQNNHSEELFINFTYNFGEKLNQRVNTTPSATKVWDKRYDEVIRENKVYLEKRLVIDIKPTRLATIGETVNVALNVSDGYDANTMGAITYSITTSSNNDNISGYTIADSVIDLSSATFANATESTRTIPVTATIATNENYAETVINYNVVVSRMDNPLNTDDALKNSNPDNAIATAVNDGQAHTLITSADLKFTGPGVTYNEDLMGDLSYEVVSSAIDGVSIKVLVVL